MYEINVKTTRETFTKKKKTIITVCRYIVVPDDNNHFYYYYCNLCTYETGTFMFMYMVDLFVSTIFFSQSFTLLHWEAGNAFGFSNESAK